MTAPDLDALAALLDKATPGPWTVDTLHWADRAHIDRALIVAAVNALPALLAYVRELESLVERMARADSGAALAMRERCAEICSKAARERTSDPTSWATAADCAAAIRALEP